jgi:fatty acid desaturase
VEPHARPTPAGPEAGIEASRPGYQPRDVAVIAACQAALIGGLTFTFGWWGYPLLWLVPVGIFAILADNFRSFAEHGHAESDQEADRHRLITYSSNPLERAFVAPMNMNYHATHHLWVAIPYYNLPAADARIRARIQGEELVWRSSYFGFLWRYVRALPLDECRQGRLPVAK